MEGIDLKRQLIAFTSIGRKGKGMDFFGKVTETVTTGGKKVAGEAKKMAEIASLKSQIASCEDVIKKTYIEIGKLFMEEHGEEANAPYEKQRQAILNAQAGIEDLRRKIQEVKGV